MKRECYARKKVVYSLSFVITKIDKEIYMELQKIIEVLKKVSVEAGKAIMDVYNNCEDMQIEYKEGDMPLTAADKAANAIIVDCLKKEFPEYAILSEEEKDNLSRLENDYCFIVDPLDGTKEFIKRNGQFTINIALAYKHKSILGVIYVPVIEELYYAAQGLGAFLQVNGQVTKLAVSNRTSDIRVVMSNSHGCPEMDQLLEKYHLTNFVSMGSSLKGCVIAKGEAEVYYRYNPTMEWDTAAMQCIVEEAGAIFRQMDGSEMTYNREDSLNRKGFYIINCQENYME